MHKAIVWTDINDNKYNSKYNNYIQKQYNNIYTFIYFDSNEYIILVIESKIFLIFDAIRAIIIIE